MLAVQGAYWVLFKERGERKKINRRLALTAELSDPSEVLQTLRKERGVDVLAHIPSLQGLKELVVQSGVRFSAKVLFFWFCIPAVLFYFLMRSAIRVEFSCGRACGSVSGGLVLSVPTKGPEPADR